MAMQSDVRLPPSLSPRCGDKDMDTASMMTDSGSAKHGAPVFAMNTMMDPNSMMDTRPSKANHGVQVFNMDTMTEDTNSMMETASSTAKHGSMIDTASSPARPGAKPAREIRSLSTAADSACSTGRDVESQDVDMVDLAYATPMVAAAESWAFDPADSVDVRPIRGKLEQPDDDDAKGPIVGRGRTDSYDTEYFPPGFDRNILEDMHSSVCRVVDDPSTHFLGDGGLEGMMSMSAIQMQILNQEAAMAREQSWASKMVTDILSGMYCCQDRPKVTTTLQAVQLEEARRALVGQDLSLQGAASSGNATFSAAAPRGG